MSLADLQALFWRAVRDDCPPAGLDDAFVSRGALDATRRMEIYHSAYWARHERCLQETFPCLLAALGADAFRRLTASYISARPSNHPCVEWAGQDLGDHLRQHASELGLEPWLGDLAQLEWARIVTWMAEDTPAQLKAESLGTEQSVNQRMRMAACLQLVYVQTRALSAFCADAVPDRAQPQTWVALWRKQRVHTLALAADQGRALEQALCGAPLARVCAELDELEDPQRTVERATRMLSQWISRGWLIGLEDHHGQG